MKINKLLIVLVALSLTACDVEVKPASSDNSEPSSINTTSQLVEPSSEANSEPVQPSSEIISSVPQVDEKATKVEALTTLANTLDNNANYTIDVELKENNSVVEKDLCEVNGNEYLFTNIASNGNKTYTYHKLNENGTVNKYYELIQGKGYSNHPEYYSNKIFDTGYFLAFGKYDCIDETLSSLLSSYSKDFSLKEVAGEKALFLAHISFKLDLQLARQYYATKGSFSRFKKESYEDWVVDNYTIFVNVENDKVTSFKIEYDCNVLLTSYGNSGAVDFEVSSSWAQHVSLEFSKFGTTTVVKPEGINA